MRSMITMKWDGVTPDQYDVIRKLVNWEGDRPKGAIFHVAGFTKKALRITDIWESEEDYVSFVHNRLMPVITQMGIKGEPNVKLFPMHAMYIPDVHLLDPI